MNKFLIILVSLFAFVLIGGAAGGGWYYQNQKFQSKDKDLTTQVAAKKTEVDELKKTKDTNGYTPKDMATNFMNEFKTSSDKAKLYLAESLQSVDLKQALKISDPTQVTVSEVVQEVTDDNAIATVNGFVTSEDNKFTAVLKMTKVDGVWKISQIN